MAVSLYFTLAKMAKRGGLSVLSFLMGYRAYRGILGFWLLEQVKLIMANPLWFFAAEHLYS